MTYWLKGCVAAWAMVGGVHAAETDLTIATEAGAIAATLTTPDDGSAAAPVVLLLHGFTGSRDELPINGTDDGVFTRTAGVLADAGYASLRIDFLGSGESEGVWADTTFSGQVRDALAAIEYLGTLSTVDSSQLAVLGWSQGGLVAAHVAAASDQVDSLILWAPVTNPVANFENIFGAKELFTAIDASVDEDVTLSLPWGVDTTLKGAFFDEMQTMSTAAALAAYDGPVQIYMGLLDTTVTPQPGAGEMLTRYHAGDNDLVELEMDHVFNVFTGPETLDTQMLPRVLDWLEGTL